MFKRVVCKFLNLLTAADRRAAAWIFILMLGSMLLELIGLSLIVPLLALVGQGDGVQTPPAFAWLLDRLGSPSREELVIGSMLILVVLFVVKGAYLFFTNWRQNVFFTGLQRQLAERLFSFYLRQPYAAHLQRNSAEMNSRLNDVEQFATALNSMLNIVAESMVLGGILALLLFTEPAGTLCVGVIVSTVFFALHFLSRGYIRRLGAERLHHSILRSQHALQGLGGVKEIKLRGREEAFAAEFARHNGGFTAAICRHHTLANLPRFCLEVLAVAGLAGLIAVMLHQGKTAENVIPILGLFAGAVFRVMPSINRILYALQNVQFLAPSINHLHDEIMAAEALPPTPAPASAVSPLPAALSSAVEFRGVSYAYPNAAGLALDAVSLHIKAGTTVGFVGASGAGKSTLVDVLLGLLPPVSGEILIDNIPMSANLRGWQQQIGYVPQTIYLTDDSLRRNIAFGLPEAEIDNDAVERAAAAAQLTDLIAALPAGLDTPVGERGIRLSGGQRQRVGIARALYASPAVLVLDEATSALDIATENEVMNAVRALHGSKTIIIVAHRLNTVAHCDLIFRLEGGKLTGMGPPETMLS